MERFETLLTAIRNDKRANISVDVRGQIFKFVRVYCEEMGVLMWDCEELNFQFFCTPGWEGDYCPADWIIFEPELMGSLTEVPEFTGNTTMDVNRYRCFVKNNILQIINEHLA